MQSENSDFKTFVSKFEKKNVELERELEQDIFKKKEFNFQNVELQNILFKLHCIVMELQEEKFKFLEDAVNENLKTVIEARQQVKDIQSRSSVQSKAAHETRQEVEAEKTKQMSRVIVNRSDHQLEHGEIPDKPSLIDADEQQSVMQGKMANSSKCYMN